MKRIFLLSVALMFLVSFAFVGKSAAEEGSGTQTGFLGEYYAKMEPGPEGGAKMRWIKPGVDFTKYNKVMLDPVVFFFANDSEYKGIDPEELKTLSDHFNLALINALKGKYPIVATPGPDVIRLRFAITDLKASKPGYSAVSSVIPVGLGISLIKKGAAGSWSGSGATTSEVMALDSLTNDVLGVAEDTRTAAFTERFSKWGSAEEAFKYWGDRLVKFMDTVQASKH